MKIRPNPVEAGRGRQRKLFLTKYHRWVKMNLRGETKVEMRGRIIWLLAFTAFFAVPAFSFSASFKVYPGARLESINEPKQSEFEAKISKAPKVITFITNDPFESVVAFYRGIVREYRIPGSNGKPAKLSSGQEVKEAYFIFDNAADLSTSKHWIKIQWPYLTKWGIQERFEKIRNVTAIIEEDKRTYP